MSRDQLGIIDLTPGEWQAPDVPAGHRDMIRMPSDLIGERPGGRVTTRPATPDEWQRYGLSHPLRPELVEDIKAGMGLEAIAVKHGASIDQVAGKVANWWSRIVRAFPEGDDEHAHAVWSQAAAVLGIRERTPPLVPRLPPANMNHGAEDGTTPDQSGDAEVENMPRRDEELRRILTPEKLAEELQRHSMKAIAQKYGRSLSTIMLLRREYNIPLPRRTEPGGASTASRTISASQRQSATDTMRTAEHHSASSQKPSIAAIPAAQPKLPPGLLIRIGDQVRVTLNVEGCKVSDALAHLRSVQTVLEPLYGKRLNVTLMVEEAAS